MQTIYKSASYSIHLYKTLPENVRQFLNTISWGSKGTVYERPVTVETAQKLYNPYVFVIEDSEKIRATVVANGYTFCLQNKYVRGYYFRYFASHLQHRGTPLIAYNSTRVLSWLEKNIHKNDFFYAYLERKNDQSTKLVQRLGYQKIGESSTIGFSRFFPKLSNRVKQATTHEQKTRIIAKLNSFYQNHVLVHTQGIHLDDSYYYIERDGQLVAGAQVIEGKWRIKKMEGLLGKCILTFVPYLPLINRLFSPKCFHFLGVEGIFYEKNNEKIFFELLEHIMANRKLHSALIWQDPSCPYYLGNNQSLGLLNTFVKGTGSFILAKGEKNDLEYLKQRPKYISCFDFV